MVAAAGGGLERAGFNNGSGVTFAPILNGCWTLAGGHGSKVYETIGDTLVAAAEAGFTTFDTAGGSRPGLAVQETGAGRWGIQSCKRAHHSACESPQHCFCANALLPAALPPRPRLKWVTCGSPARSRRHLWPL